QPIHRRNKLRRYLVRFLIFILSVFVAAESLAANPPGTIIDLGLWKLTLPIDTTHPGRPDEIVSPRRATFVAASIFEATEDGMGVIFRAPCGGATTSGSNYP